MCLAVPGQLIQCVDGEAVVDLHGNQVPISTALVPAASVGDWVLVHAGFAIQKLSEEDAQKTFAILKDIEQSGLK